MWLRTEHGKGCMLLYVVRTCPSCSHLIILVVVRATDKHLCSSFEV